MIQGLGNAGYQPDEDVRGVYTAYLADYGLKHPKGTFIEEFMKPTPPAPEYAMDPGMIGKKAASTDIAIIAIGRNAGEGKDRQVGGDYELTDAELALIKNVADAYHAQHKKVVVVLNIGGVIDVMPWRDNADAILLAWQPGLEGGNAIADILSGKVNPSGKLATTFPAAYSDVPSAKNFPGKEFPEKTTTGMFGMKAIPAEVTYEEGVYVGYRYYNTFKVKTAYAFGYGLSYTSFDYSKLTLSSSSFNGGLTASVIITNKGRVAGKEVVQLYLSAPGKKLDKPAEELKGFGKTRLLQPGESQTLVFTLMPRDLASFDAASSSWVAEAGKYAVRVGASCVDIRQKADFTLAGDMVVEKEDKVLVPQVTITELKPR